MTKITVVTGNPRPQSRTHSVARAVADAIAAGFGAGPARCQDRPLPECGAARRGCRWR